MERWENVEDYNVPRFTATDYLNYYDLNEIEDLVEGLATLYERTYTKTTWTLNQDRILNTDFQNIEDELDYYNQLYNLNYKKKLWYRPTGRAISYKDINRWLDLIYYGFNLKTATKISLKSGTAKASDEIKQLNIVEEG